LVVAVRGKSPEAAAQFADESLDWVFIDGAHDEASVRADMLGWWRKIKPGGALCGHDAVPGCEVLPVVLEFSARWGIEIVPRTQGIWVAKKEAPE
jgi:predicted O-methyltransferase YrrM